MIFESPTGICAEFPTAAGSLYSSESLSDLVNRRFDKTIYGMIANLEGDISQDELAIMCEALKDSGEFQLIGFKLVDGEVVAIIDMPDDMAASLVGKRTRAKMITKSHSVFERKIERVGEVLAFFVEVS